MLVLIVLYFYKDIFLTKSISEISNIPVLLYVVSMRSLVGVVFMIIGFLANKLSLFDSKVVRSASVLSIFAFLNRDVDINNLVFYNELLYIIFAFLGTILVINVAKVVSKLCLVKSFFLLFGKESLFVMLTHTIFFIIQGSLFLSSRLFTSQLFTLLFAILVSIAVQYLLIRIKCRAYQKYPVLNNYFV